MKKSNLLEKSLIYISFILTLFISLRQWNMDRQKKVVYVEIGRLVNEYEFKKELEKSSDANLYKIKHVFDSLLVIKKTLQKVASASLDSQILKVENAYRQYAEISTKELTKKVWDRINPLMIEFGNQNNFEFILGANGAGSILFGKDAVDKTEDAVKFLNSKYERGK